MVVAADVEQAGAGTRLSLFHYTIQGLPLG